MATIPKYKLRRRARERFEFQRMVLLAFYGDAVGTDWVKRHAASVPQLSRAGNPSSVVCGFDQQCASEVMSGAARSGAA